MRSPAAVIVDLVAAGLRAVAARALALRGPSARHGAAWREAARAAGLGAVEESGDGLAGWAGPLRVRLDRYADSDSRGTRITVSGPAMPDLTVRPEGLGSTIRGARGVREVEIGHDTFDAAAWVEGSSTLARAVLDADVRRALRALFDGRLEQPGHSSFFASGRLEEGVLRLDVPDAPPVARRPGLGERGEPGEEPGAYAYLGSLEHLGEVLTRTIALARRLATPAHLPRRLAENLKSEPVAGVRLQVLTTLAREFPKDPATREALEAAREDPDAEVRLRAGIALGAEGRDVLLAIAGGEGATDETTQRAVAALGWHLTTPEALDILKNALRTRREATARACLGALGQRRGAQVVSTLARVLAVEKPGLAAAAAEALGATGDPSGEPALLAALEGEAPEVRVAAARALGRMGTTAAVQALKDLEERDRACRASARQAIAEIQSRLTGAEPGQLSLAGGESGQLSLAEGEEGRLSLPEGRGGERQPPGGRTGRGVGVKSLGEVVAGVLAPFRRARRSVQAGIDEVRRLSLRTRTSWNDVASAAGLTVLPDSDGVAWGTGSLRVELSSYGDENASGTRIWISGPTLSTDLTLRPQRARDSSSGVREIEIGDPAFDRAAWVEGPPALVRSLLDADTRRAVLGLLEGRLERPSLTPFAAEGRVELGELSVDVPDFTGDAAWDISTELLTPKRPRVDASGQLCVCGSAQLPAVLRLLLAIARRLEAPEDVPRRLADNLRTEPLAGVRLQCLTTLAREHPDHPATREALLAAREDPDAQVRLRAGVSLGPEGRDVILAIARGEGAPDETTARAVAALARGLSADEATALLRSALRTRRQETALACLRVLARRHEAVVVPTLAKVLAVAKPELAAAAADALGAAGDASGERALLSALEAADPAVRAAAARALGRVGTAAAVLPLKELEERDRPCRATARQAIAEIQERLTGAEPGQLSLAGGESGQLSIAQGEGGWLSLAKGGSDGGSPSRAMPENTLRASLPTGPTGVAQDDKGPSGPGRRGPSG